MMEINGRLGIFGASWWQTSFGWLWFGGETLKVGLEIEAAENAEEDANGNAWPPVFEMPECWR
jgi:hypothetical protein